MFEDNFSSGRSRAGPLGSVQKALNFVGEMNSFFQCPKLNKDKSRVQKVQRFACLGSVPRIRSGASGSEKRSSSLKRKVLCPDDVVSDTWVGSMERNHGTGIQPEVHIETRRSRGKGTMARTNGDFRVWSRV